MLKIGKISKDFKLPEIIEIEKLFFDGVNGKDVYNISKSFKIAGEEFLFGRVEPRDNSELSVVFLFKKVGKRWVRDEKFSPLENSEDPFISFIDGEFVLGCVEVMKTEKGGFDSENKLNYRTVFYKGKYPCHLKRILEGPWNMKDIRFVQLPDKRLAVFSRPQGGIAGRGKIGFFIADSLKEINSEKLYGAPLLSYFHNSEWGGVNDIHILDRSNIGVLGHIAKRNENNSLSYYPIVFTLNLENKKYSKIKIIFKKKDLPKGESKHEGLADVIFPGGFNKNEDDTVNLYFGAGDAEAYRIRMKNPFLELGGNTIKLGRSSKRPRREDWGS